MTEEAPVSEQIRRILHEIAELDVDDDLVRTGDLGRELDFSEYRGLFEETKTFSLSVVDLPWEDTTPSMQNNALSHVQSIQSYIDGIQQFSPSELLGQDLRQERDSRGINLRNGIDSFKDYVIPFIGYLSWRAFSTERYQQDLDEVVRQSRETAAETNRELEELKSQGDEIIRGIRATSAEVGVSQEAATFHEAAGRYTRASYWYLAAAVLLALATIGAGVAIIFAWNTSGDITDASVLQLVLVKTAILAVTTYGTVTAIRFFRSNTHLAAVNRHREDALRTFKTFVEGTESTEIKDKILLAAAHAAFGQTSTGLVSDKGDGGNMLEVLDGISGNLIRRS